MHYVIVAILIAGTQLAPDGLPVGSNQDSDAKLKAWDACLKKAIINPAELTNDPSDLVVQVALHICENELSGARFAWRRNLVANSTFRPTDAEAEKMAEETFDKFTKSRRTSLLTAVSFIRQKQTLDKMKEDLRKKLP